MSDVFDQLMAPAETESLFYGVMIGLVSNNKDPDGLGRVKVTLPWLDDKIETNWARVVTPMAGKDRGLYTLPEVDDEVAVMFEHGNLEWPFVIGSLWNGKDKPPASNADGKNNHRVIKSRSGHTLTFDDTDKAEQIVIADKSGKNKITISTKDNTIAIAADADISITSAKGKLKLSGKGVEITSQGAVKVEASGNMDLKAGPQLNVKGSKVNIN